MSFQAAVFVNKEKCHNSLHFATAEEAKGYGENLFMRWTLMDRYEVEETEHPVNYQWTAEGLKSIEEQSTS